MHTWPIRLYTLFGFAVSATIALLFAMHLVSYLYPLESAQNIHGISVSQPFTKSAKKAYNSIEKLTVQPAHDVMDLNISLSYNLTGLFNWNTKQVYASVIAVYNDTAGLQQQTVWDKIVTRNHRKVYNGTVKAIYPLHSYNIKDGFKNLEKIDLVFYTQVMPYAGLFRTARHTFTDVPITRKEGSNTSSKR
ncbi:Signal peptidase subunit [Giardia duodenalis]|uniref:Signal peptidase complex subunit 3 n=1 Tax=Giardia intestinalis (strain ATCC 50803 / WB clone C6) TaxID=184922 RepID=D3KGK8_GIAIC|nr:Signal peptidase subunit [Giardia intestinalis]KAE8302448.1 Signal peptidase subunit [Giardia intestinalis]